MKFFPNTFLTRLIRLGFLWAVFFTMSFSCTWEEVKQGGYNAMQERNTQHCLDNPSRSPAECLSQPSYETYQKQKESTP